MQESVTATNAADELRTLRHRADAIVGDEAVVRRRVEPRTRAALVRCGRSDEFVTAARTHVHKLIGSAERRAGNDPAVELVLYHRRDVSLCLVLVSSLRVLAMCTKAENDHQPEAPMVRNRPGSEEVGREVQLVWCQACLPC